jgi:hypothetical protein
MTPDRTPQPPPRRSLLPIELAPQLQARRVRALSGTLTRLGIALSLADGETEAETALLIEQVEEVTACITEAPANDIDDLRTKATILRHRLEDQLSPEAPAEALTLALAAALLRDFDRLAA